MNRGRMQQIGYNVRIEEEEDVTSKCKMCNLPKRVSSKRLLISYYVSIGTTYKSFGFSLPQLIILSGRDIQCIKQSSTIPDSPTPYLNTIVVTIIV